MTVAFDAWTPTGAAANSFTTTDPFTFSHTPVGTPRGVLVFAVGNSVDTDVIDGTVSYGGVALTRVPTNGFAADSNAELGTAYAYFLGASIPTGAQTVSIAHTASAEVKWAVCVTLTAATDTEVGDSGRLQGNQADAQITTTTAAASLRFSVLFSGLPAPNDNTAITDVSAVGSSPRFDFGNQSAVVGRQTSAASTGAFTIGYTGSTDDVAMIAVAIQEVASGNTGTIAATQAANTAALTGTVGIPGTVAATQANQTAALSGTVANPITGTIAANQNDNAGAFTGTETISGTIAATQAAQTMAATGTVANPVTGTIGATQADQIGAFAGDVVSDGTLAATQQNQTGAFNGTVINPITGTIAATQANQVGAFSGISLVAVTGTIASIQADQAGSFNGTQNIPAVTGTISATQDPNVGLFDGTAFGVVTGTIAAVQDPNVGNFIGNNTTPVIPAPGTAVCEVGGPTAVCVLTAPSAACTISQVSVAGTDTVVTTTFRNAAGTLTDPAAVTATVQHPDGTQTSPIPTSSSVGIWTTVISSGAGEDGWWFGQISGTGNGVNAVCTFSFCLTPSLVLV